MFGYWMEQEVRSQPQLLAENCEGYFEQAQRGLGDTEPEMVLLVARGSSDNAALFARYLIEIHLGIPVSLAAPSVLTRFHASMKYPKCLGIGISQSGAAPDVAEVLQQLNDAGHQTLSITNRENSLVANTASSHVFLGVGEEKSVAATKTFTATLLALIQVIRAMGGTLDSPLGHLPSQEWQEQQRATAESEAGHLNRYAPIFCLSRGYGFSIAQETALKLMECALIPAKSYSTADFEHGPKALAGPGSAAIVYGEHGENLQKQGCRIIEAPAYHGPDFMAPISQIMFGQWMALYAARTRNLNPDDPTFIQKVTETL